MDNLSKVGYPAQKYADNLLLFPMTGSPIKKCRSRIAGLNLFSGYGFLYQKAQSSGTFIDLYTPTGLPGGFIRKIRSVLFNCCGNKKTGVKYIDERLVIISSGRIPKNRLDEKRVDLFLEINKKGFPYKIIIKTIASIICLL